MNPLNTIQGTIIAGVVIAVAIALTTMGINPLEQSMIMWLHVGAGVTWIGLLYYFNFVQVPALAAAAKDQGGPGGAGISKYVAPRALLWFRWAAVATVLFGLLLPEIRVSGSVGDLLMLKDGYRTIGIGMWLGIIMALNVWLVIWPNQKRALGIVAASDEAKAKSASLAMMASRTNLILSLPMLYCMIMGAHVG